MRARAERGPDAGLNERSPRRITAEAGEPCLGHTPLSYRRGGATE